MTRYILIGLLWSVSVLNASAASTQLSSTGTLFSYKGLIAKARQLAEQDYQPRAIRAPQLIHQIDYSVLQHVHYRIDKSIYLNPQLPLQFYPVGRLFPKAVQISQVIDGRAYPFAYHRSNFSMPADSPVAKLPDDIGYAGFSLMRSDLSHFWGSFLGASYFRLRGNQHQEGLSARALALNSGIASVKEEFPDFTHFWLQTVPNHPNQVVIFALLQSKSVTGAYRFHLTNTAKHGQIVNVDSHLFFRQHVKRIGIAPLSSMYWYSESNRNTAFDWRPEVHDSDGLAIETHDQQFIWRPLNNPFKPFTQSFNGEGVKGFGLMQRDRNFDHYQDALVFYNRRPSVWIEPLAQSFGAGQIQLVELPTTRETNDNIVVFFKPKGPLPLHQDIHFSYRMRWLDHPMPAISKDYAKVVATRVGQGGLAGMKPHGGPIKMAVDFSGGALTKLSAKQAVLVQPVVKLSHGYAHRVSIQRTPTGIWRVFFDADASQPIDGKVYLRIGQHILSEVWMDRIDETLFNRVHR
ncbi:glucan biosynthesis protein [Celerinatantimonas yamalensis]|uniref:Glucan biosynthesis protein n=1 Tax=Celerinatantimonas yamalensis TaxID=559956 RepID=A0ABW9G9R1_9GAMM